MSRKKSSYDKIVCKNIKELRLKSKHTGSKFADNIGISQGHLSDIENGKVIPNKTTLLAISYSYNLDIDRLLTDESEIERRLEIKPKMRVAEEALIYKVGKLDSDPGVADLLEAARRVLKSGNQIAFDALERNIRYFDHAIETEKRLGILESRLEVLEKQLSQKPDKNIEQKVM